MVFPCQAQAGLSAWRPSVLRQKGETVKIRHLVGLVMASMLIAPAAHAQGGWISSGFVSFDGHERLPALMAGAKIRSKTIIVARKRKSAAASEWCVRTWYKNSLEGLSWRNTAGVAVFNVPCSNVQLLRFREQLQVVDTAR